MVLVGDDRQISAVESGGMFAALVRDRDGLAPALSDVRRFAHEWEKAASVELRAGISRRHRRLHRARADQRGEP